MEKGLIEESAPKAKVQPKEPEEQQVAKYLKISGDMIAGLRDKIGAASKNVDGAANAANAVIDKIDMEVDLSDIVRFYGGLGALVQIFDVLKQDGVKDFSQEEKQEIIAKVLSRQVEKGIKEGKYDPHEMLAAAKEAQAKLDAAKQTPEQQMPPQGGVV